MSDVEFIKVDIEDNDIRLDRWFRRYYEDVLHGTLEKALRKGQIKVNGKKIKSNYRLQAGDEIRIPPLVRRDPNDFEPIQKTKKITQDDINMIQNAVIFKNDEIIVLNKPAGIACQGGVGIDMSIDGLLDHLKFEKESRPKLVHRLDKDTSGVLLLARNVSTASKIAEKFRNRNMEKTYWALVVGAPNDLEGKISAPILKRETGIGKEKMVVDQQNGKRAVTTFKVLENMAGRLSLLELKPITGRTHQIRVHLQSIRHPILGDGKYGGKEAFINGFSKKMHLHARKIIFEDTNGVTREFIADISGSMQESFKMLELDQKLY